MGLRQWDTGATEAMLPVDTLFKIVETGEVSLLAPTVLGVVHVLMIEHVVLVFLGPLLVGDDVISY